MSMYRYGAGMNPEENTLKRKVTLWQAAAAVLLVAVILLTVFLIRSGRLSERVGNEILNYVRADVSSAISVVNRMDRLATSKTSSDIGKARQYVYNMEQMNRMYQSLYGHPIHESIGEAVAALYSDLENFDNQTMSAKNSTLDAQKLLLNHLESLQSLLSPDL